MCAWHWIDSMFLYFSAMEALPAWWNFLWTQLRTSCRKIRRRSKRPATHPKCLPLFSKRQKRMPDKTCHMSTKFNKCRIACVDLWIMLFLDRCTQCSVKQNLSQRSKHVAEASHWRWSGDALAKRADISTASVFTAVDIYWPSSILYITRISFFSVKFLWWGRLASASKCKRTRHVLYIFLYYIKLYNVTVTIVYIIYMFIYVTLVHIVASHS